MSRHLQQREHVKVDSNFTQFRFIVLYLLRFKLTTKSSLFILFILVCCLGEAVIAALAVQGSSSAGVCEQALRVIVNLGTDSALNTRLGHAGACEGGQVILNGDSLTE